MLYTHLLLWRNRRKLYRLSRRLHRQLFHLQLVVNQAVVVLQRVLQKPLGMVGTFMVAGQRQVKSLTRTLTQWRVLKPGGWFVGTAVGWRVQHNVLIGSHDQDWKLPVTYYNSRMLKDLMKGFDKVSVRGLNYLGNILNKDGKYLMKEFNHFGKVAPDLARHLVFVGQKPL